MMACYALVLKLLFPYFTRKIFFRFRINFFLFIIGHYNPLIRLIDLVTHTTNVMCVNFIHKWRNLQFKVDSERQIFGETFHGNFIYSQGFCQHLLRGNSRKILLFWVQTQYLATRLESICHANFIGVHQ